MIRNSSQGSAMISAALVVAMMAAAASANGAPLGGPRSLLPGGGSQRTDCIVEFSSRRLSYITPQPRRRQMRLNCTDGSQCDTDGRRNDRCTLTVALCINNADPTLPACKSGIVVSVEVRQKRSRRDPELAALQAAVTAVGLPTAENACSEPVEISVPVRVRGTKKRPGKKRITVIARTRDATRDRDALRIACLPAPTEPPAANSPPRVQGRATPAAGKAPLMVTFTATATDPDGDTTSVMWNFGDGTGSSGTEVSHIYSEPGAFKATVAAVDPKGAQSEHDLGIIVAPPNQAPTAKAMAVPAKGSVPLTVLFSVLAEDPDGEVARLSWQFGDGGTATGSSPRHTYREAGTFVANVTVTDDSGVSARSQVTIVAAPPAGGLSIQHANRYPTRLAEGPEGRLYVSDARVGSVFIYDADLKLVGELKDFDRPLGVAVSQEGNIYVGCKGNNNVEVYSPTGISLFTIDDGNIRMPNDLAIDRQGRLYVADSLSNTVKVYDSTGGWLRNIDWPDGGDGVMLFPSALAIAYRRDPGGTETGELYVADQDQARVLVFDLEGNLLRTYGSPVPAFSSDWKGKFVKLQSLGVDTQGRLHAADSYLNKIQILDATTGAYLDSYGTFGTDAGQLNVPLDIVVTRGGKVVVANAENHRVEVIYTVP